MLFMCVVLDNGYVLIKPILSQVLHVAYPVALTNPHRAQGDMKTI